MNQGAAHAADRFPALAPAPVLRAPRGPQDPGQGFDANRDRVLITLLALDLMLMAFFVVLNSAATFDSKRGAEVASSMPAAAPAAPSLTALAPAAVPSPAVSSPTAPPAAPPVETSAASIASVGVGTSARAAAAAELNAAVSDVFANYLPAGTGADTDADNGRVDVDMPARYASADALPPAVITGLARVMENSPPGYRTELVISTQGEWLNGLAHLAQDLTARGVDARTLSVGVLTGPASSGPASSDQSSPGMHFTFLLLEPGEESRAPRAVGRRRL